MRIFVVFFSLSFALVFAQTPEPLDRSGNAFLRGCSAIEKAQTTEAESELVARCAYYVLGVVQGAEFGQSILETKMGKKAPELFCRPGNAENGQLLRVTVKYIREAPEFSHLPTPDLIINAMRMAYPSK